MKILQIIGTVNPAYGGPVAVFEQLSAELNRMGHSTERVTLDGAGDEWLDKRTFDVHVLGPSIGRYRYSKRLLPWLRRNAHRFDAVIVHGIWQYQSLAVRRALKCLNVPYFVYVHGALDPWFRERFPLKHWKKWLYWP